MANESLGNSGGRASPGTAAATLASGAAGGASGAAVRYWRDVYHEP